MRERKGGGKPSLSLSLSHTHTHTHTHTQELLFKLVERPVNDNAGPGRDPEAIASAEIARLVALLRPDKREGVVLSACQRLTIIFKNEPHHKKYLVMNRGVTSLIELLDLPSHQIAYSVLQVTRPMGKGVALKNGAKSVCMSKRSCVNQIHGRS